MKMELEQEDDKSMANENAGSGKRGRGRPRGSVNKPIIIVNDVVPNSRASKKTDFFSSGTLLKQKVKKRGRPKKIRILGRPRKIPLSPEEEAERISRLNRKRRISKPLGRQRIHPLKVVPKSTKGRGRPRKFKSLASLNSTEDKNLRSLTITDLGEDRSRRRARTPGSLNKKLGRPSAKRLIKDTSSKQSSPPGPGVTPQVIIEQNLSPRKRGRPRSSGQKLDFGRRSDGPSSRKKGAPPGSSNKVNVVNQHSDGTPRTRGRSAGSGTKLKI